MKQPLENNLTELTRSVVESYDKDPATHRIGESFLPSRSKIIEIIDHLRQLLFPGFFGHKRLTDANISYHVGNLLVRVANELTEQINHCLCTETEASDRDPNICRDKAVELTNRFLQRLPELRGILALDAQAALDGDPAAKSLSEIVYCYPGFLAVTVHRIAHELVQLGIPLMPRIMSEHAHGVTGADIHPGAKLGKRFFVDHATGVVIGETTVIGNNVKIYQGVTLGGKSFPKDARGRLIKGLKRHPTLEDNVTIYANATILGGETVIGEGVTVAGNTFVTESITAKSLVAQEPPKLKVKSKHRRSAAEPNENRQPE